MTTTGYIWLDIIITITITLFASSGFWLYRTKKIENRSMVEKLLVGLAHDRITWLGHLYLSRGFLTHEEYENLNDYLFLPYEKLGGNGTAKKVMDDIRKLPLRIDHAHPYPHQYPTNEKKGQ